MSGSWRERISTIGTKSIGVFNIIMALAVLVSLGSKIAWAQGTIFLPFGMAIAVVCESLLILLAFLSGVGCLKRSLMLGRYVGSACCVAMMAYYTASSVASLKMASAPIVRILFLQWLLSPLIVYGAILILLNTWLRNSFTEKAEKSA